MNSYVKKAAELLLPRRTWTTLQSIHSRNSQERGFAELGISAATRELADEYGLTVLAGPFRGMKYSRESLLRRNGVYLIFGTYEMELHGVVEEALSRRYDSVFDIGCAEGYYAVGLALRTGLVVHAFDCEPRERFHCRRMARENGVADRVRVSSWCSGETLRKTASGRCLILCDCEGFEVELFSPETVAALCRCDLIIELHELFDFSVHQLILDRFEKTHTAQFIPSDRFLRSGLVPQKWMEYSRESRPASQEWVYLRTRTDGASTAAL